MDVYSYQRLIGKIDDHEGLRAEFIRIFDRASKKEMAVFARSYADHILKLSGFEAHAELRAALDAVQEWIEGQTNYHQARTLAYAHLNKEARGTEDAVRKRFIKTMSQLVCVPHVKAHGLWGTDMAITLVNALFPGDWDKVKVERQTQIEILRAVIGMRESDGGKSSV